MTEQELKHYAKRFCDNSQDYLEEYRNDVDYRILENALKELPIAFNKWQIELLNSATIASTIKTPPLNPFVAAGIGNAIAGVGGAVIMGVGAQKRMDSYTDTVELFNRYLASVKTAGEKVAILVDEIGKIVNRPLMTMDEAYHRAISGMHDGATSMELQESILLFEKIISQYDCRERHDECINRLNETIRREENEAANREREAANKAMYDNAIAKMDDKFIGVSELEDVLKDLKSLQEWKNVNDEIIKCNECIREAKKRESKSIRKLIRVGIIALIVVAIAVALRLAFDDQIKSKRFEQANILMQQGEYEKAAEMFGYAGYETYKEYCQAMNRLNTLSYGDEFGSTYYTIVTYNYLDNLDELKNKNVAFSILDSMRGKWYESDSDYPSWIICDENGYAVHQFSTTDENMNVFNFYIMISKDTMYKFELRQELDGKSNGELYIHKEGDLAVNSFYDFNTYKKR